MTTMTLRPPATQPAQCQQRIGAVECGDKAVYLVEFKLAKSDKGVPRFAPMCRICLGLCEQAVYDFEPITAS